MTTQQNEFAFDAAAAPAVPRRVSTKRVRATSAKATGITMSRWQLDLFVKCARCFWLLKRHGIKQPASFPLTLNNAMDTLLKAEFDAYRAQGASHPILIAHQVVARLFSDVEQLKVWRNNFAGLRWTNPEGHTLFGAVDEILQFPDGSLAVLDYKSSGAKQAKIYPSYQLQMDVYTYLLQQMGHRTAPQAYMAFFMATKEEGFDGRLPFHPILLTVTPQPERVAPLMTQAVAVARSDRMPVAGTSCDLCRWSGEMQRAVL